MLLFVCRGGGGAGEVLTPDGPCDSCSSARQSGLAELHSCLLKLFRRVRERGGGGGR